jgi:hypothetical protein
VKRATALAESFRERRAEFSTRIGARGEGFEFGEYGSLHPRLQTQIEEMIRVLKLAEAAARLGNAEAECQLNTLRGKLGNFRRMLRQPDSFQASDFFMTVAREVLPTWVFEAVMTDARWMRELEAQDTAAAIDAAIGPPKGSSELATMRNAWRKKQRRRDL